MSQKAHRMDLFSSKQNFSLIISKIFCSGAVKANNKKRHIAKLYELDLSQHREILVHVTVQNWGKLSNSFPLSGGFLILSFILTLKNCVIHFKH